MYMLENALVMFAVAICQHATLSASIFTPVCSAACTLLSEQEEKEETTLAFLIWDRILPPP